MRVRLCCVTIALCLALWGCGSSGGDSSGGSGGTSGGFGSSGTTTPPSTTTGTSSNDEAEDAGALYEPAEPTNSRIPSSPSNSWSSTETAVLQTDSPLLGDGEQQRYALLPEHKDGKGNRRPGEPF